MIQNVTEKLAEQVAQQREQVIANVLPSGFTLDEIRKRVTLVKFFGSQNETLCLDGNPIVTFMPPEVEHVKFRGSEYYKLHLPVEYHHKDYEPKK